MSRTFTLGRTPTRIVGVAALALAAQLALPIAAEAGVSGPAFYVDGELYRTVGTPSDFSGTGAPEDSFDIIYAIDGARNVAEAKPGDRDFNGGRWRVHAVSIANLTATIAAVDTNDSGTLDFAEEVEAAIGLGLAVDGGVVASFECPVIPSPRS